jgi:ATP-dependent helicase IRC3
MNEANDFYREYNLTAERKQPPERLPVAHQSEALEELHQWFKAKPTPKAGGILVLPTGGGKTFAAVHFLCAGPLSTGYKVLWLAHTHHLLEQAFSSFETEVMWIAEPKRNLNVRIVSGADMYFPMHRIRISDDVLICTLQTVTRAYQRRQPQFEAFLDAVGDKLFVVFDEAHHSPAPSYRKLVTGLRKRCPGMYLLGLTATPTYSDEKKRGWLKELFPQGIIYQETPQDLMAAGILAQPVLEEFHTDITPEFDEREYQKWVGTYRDIPDDIITQLAERRERNVFIADTYAKHKGHYGKTIVFADRWPQCIQLKEFLQARGVRADAVFHHSVKGPSGLGSAQERNAQALEAFRRNELDVLLNIRMLTEGTDVPDVQTVFLTRQTTSRILLTQMVGRALRGPRFGGTEKAYIVSFIDDWRHLINWAEYDQLAEALADERVTEYGERPPLHLISIDLVRQLVRQMDSKLNISPAPFLTFMPIGWYRVEFVALVEGSDESETVRQLVMVFDNERESYEAFIHHLTRAKIDEFAAEDINFDDQQARLEDWCNRFFSQVEVHLGESLLINLFHIARHMAQNDGEPPVFFEFEKRQAHDLDGLAQKSLEERFDRLRENRHLQEEYYREDRYWEVLYPNYGFFKSQYDACMNRLLGIRPQADEKNYVAPEALSSGPSEEVKRQVKERDSYRCLCCGESQRRLLQVDHIEPRYIGGDHSLDNLQTLCRICNGIKADQTIDFRTHTSPLRSPLSPSDFPRLRVPRQVTDTEQWKQSLCRSINFFYHCSALKPGSTKIKARGENFRHWEVHLYSNIDPRWLEPCLEGVVKQVRHLRKEAGLQEGLERITVKAVNQRAVSYSVVRSSGLWSKF